MQIYLRYSFRNVYARYTISGASPIEKRNLMLPCVLHSERKRGTYPRFKTYSDLWQRKNSNFEMISREVPQGTQVLRPPNGRAQSCTPCGNVFLPTYVGSVAQCSIAIFAPTLVIERKSCFLRRKMRYICYQLLCEYLILSTIFNVMPSQHTRHPKPGLAPREARRYTARNGSGSLLTHIVADGYTRYLYRAQARLISTLNRSKMHRKKDACISKNALCLSTSKTSGARTCAALCAAIYGAEGICKFICDIHSETYMSDILYRAQVRI